MENLRKTRINLYIILSAFLLPIVLAIAIYKYKFVTFSTKNYGELVHQNLFIDHVTNGSVKKGNWILLYSDPELYNRLSKVKLALGKDQARVDVINLAMKIDSSKFVLIDPQNNPVLLYHKEVHKDVGRILLDLKNLLRYSYAG
jgi:hypothetical protein